MSLSELKKVFSTQLRINILSGSFAVGVGIIVSAVKFPLYIHLLGYEQYGIWLLLSTILPFAQMGLLGIGPALVKLVAEEYGQENKEAIREYFVTAICMLVATGAVIVATSILFRKQIILLMGMGGENAELAGGLLIYMVIFSIGVLACQVVLSTVSGVGRMDISNYSRIALQVLPIPISLPLLLSGKGVVSLLVANSATYLLVLVFNYILLGRIVKVNLLAIGSCSLRRFQRMITFGGTIFAGSMLNMILLPVTKIIVARTIAVEGVPVFELAYRVSMQVRSLFQVALGALLPEISKLSSEQRRESSVKMEKIIAKSYRLLFLGAIPFYVLVFMVAGFVFRIWLGENFIPTLPGVFRVMLLSSGISLVGVIPYYVFMGRGHVKIILIHHIIIACSTLLLVGSMDRFLSSLNLISISWCFVAGTFLGVGYLFLAQLKR